MGGLVILLVKLTWLKIHIVRSDTEDIVKKHSLCLLNGDLNDESF